MTVKLAISVIAMSRQPLAVAFNENVAVVRRRPHEGLDFFRGCEVSGLRNFDPFAGRTHSDHAVNRPGFDSCLMNRHNQVSCKSRGAESTLTGREIAKPIPLA